MEETQEKIANGKPATENFEEIVALSDDERQETEGRAEEFVKSQISVLPKKNMTEISKDRDLLLGALGQNIRLEHAIIDNYAEQDRISNEIKDINTRPELVLPVYTDKPHPKQPDKEEFIPIKVSSGYSAIWTKKSISILCLILSICIVIASCLGIVLRDDKNAGTIIIVCSIGLAIGAMSVILYKIMKPILMMGICAIVYTGLIIIIFPIVAIINTSKKSSIEKAYKDTIYRWTQTKKKIDDENKAKRLSNEQTCNEMIRKADKEWRDGAENRKEQTKQLQIEQLKLQIFCEKTKEALAVANQKFNMPNAYTDLTIQEDVYHYVRLYRAYNLAEALNLYEMEKRARLNEEKEEKYREKALTCLQDIYIESIRSNKKREEIEAKRVEQERQYMLAMQREAEKQTDFLRKSNELKAESNAQAKAAQEEAERSNREMERQLATQSEYAIRDYRGW